MDNQKPENGISILLIEDNAGLSDATSRILMRSGYTVHVAGDLRSARELLAEMEPDVILLDVMLPDGDGFEFCREIRDRTRAHIIFITAKSEHKDMLRGLTGGGDAYITKPFHASEMLAKIGAAVRRRNFERDSERCYTLGALTLDCVSARAYVGGEDLLLKPKEFSLLHLFVLHENQALATEYIYEAVWNEPMHGGTGTLRYHISNLRKKIEDSGYTIAAVRGGGYCLELM